MTPENFTQFCKDICPACKADIIVRYRADTGEYVHDSMTGKPGFAHSLCLANHFRKKYEDKARGQSGSGTESSQ